MPYRPEGYSGIRTAWRDSCQSLSWCDGDLPVWASSWKSRRWRWSWWEQRSLPLWSGWNTELRNWRLWRPESDTRTPTTNRSTAGTPDSQTHYPWTNQKRHMRDARNNSPSQIVMKQMARFVRYMFVYMMIMSQLCHSTMGWNPQQAGQMRV